MKRPGFTLMELLVYVGMVSIALVIFMNFMIGIFANSSRADASQQVVESGRLIIAKMTEAIHSATSVDPDASDFTNDPGRIVLTTVTPTSTSTTTYDVNDSRFRENADPITSTSVQITSFKPEQFGNTLKITLTIASNAAEPNQPKPLTFVTTLTPRQDIY
jgi:type II secretory pathway pseudopilin PulG